jgi:hypothetical protein
VQYLTTQLIDRQVDVLIVLHIPFLTSAICVRYIIIINDNTCCVVDHTCAVQVLVLKNMVERSELEDDSEFNDIKEDVTDECSQHGRVRQVLLPRLKDGFPYEVEGSIFVEFEMPDGARAAAMALRGRKFADKTVALSYVRASTPYNMMFAVIALCIADAA